jgi:DNA-binding winged helix-turn-helix (wHTH) protein/tetratricopeptide (TPR) repeat protein
MPKLESPNYRFGEYVLDVRERRLTGGGQDTYLPPKMFQTLLYLVIRSGHLVTKKELLDAIWQDVAVTENALTRCIKDVRLALRDDVRRPRFIETIPRVGYKFIAEVEPVASRSQESPHFEPESFRSQAWDWAENSARREQEGEHPEKDISVPGPSSPRGPVGPAYLWGRPVIVGIVILGGMIVLMGTSYLLRHRNRPLPFRARDFVLITDLSNQTGDDLFDRSLATAFTISMEQSAYANVFPRARINSTLSRMGMPSGQSVDEEVGREICLRENVRGLISLEIGKIGRQYLLSARLIDPQTGNAVRSHGVYAQDQDHVLSSLQSLASDVRSDLGESLTSLERSNLNLMQVTTPSLRALKLYSDGIALWEKGEYGTAVQQYQSAIGEDPAFAQAHAALGNAYFSHIYSKPELGKQHYEEALRLSERVTERERQSIRMGYESDLGHSDIARDLYESYLQTYPDDFRVRYNFGHLLMLNNQYEKAILQYREALRLAPDSASARINIATSCTQLGRFPEALENYGEAFKLEPAWETQGNLNQEYGFALVKTGNQEKARAAFTQGLLGDKPMALRSLALLDMYEGRYRQAKARFEEAISLNKSNKNYLGEARNHLFLSMLLEGQGDRAGSVTELRNADGIFESAGSVPWLAARIGIGYARAGELRSSAHLLAVTRKKTDTNSPEQRSDLARLEAEILLARGNRHEALRLFVLADNEFHNAFSVESLARAYWLAADTNRAIETYDRFLAMKGRSLGLEPQQPWIESHYRLAKMLLGRGDHHKAKELLNTLLQLWKDADPDLPLLRDAGRLQAELVDSPAK